MKEVVKRTETIDPHLETTIDDQNYLASSSTLEMLGIIKVLPQEETVVSQLKTKEVLRMDLSLGVEMGEQSQDNLSCGMGGKKQWLDNYLLMIVLLPTTILRERWRH